MKLEVKSLSFGYEQSRLILKDIFFTCTDAQVLCILGANGTGKSTLLKCITGEEKAKGEILIDGNLIDSYSSQELAQRFAYIPQITVPTFPFRVLDVVLMGRTAHMKYFSSPDLEDEKTALENLHFLGIEHLKDKAFTEISGGERQLVMIAAALTQEPELMILDEPTAHLDFGNAHRFLELVLKLRRRGVGIIMTTHFPDHALFLGGDTIILKGGMVWKRGTARDIITEANMTDLYRLNVHIREFGDREVCIPGELSHEAHATAMG